jgi:hypothetical protein
MTEDTIYGLGAIEDPPDDRDYPLDALYAAEGIDPTPEDALPSAYRAPGMPAVLDQGSSPMCVAFGSSGIKGWQDRRDQDRYFDFDEPTFFRRIGGTQNGAVPRVAMERLRAYGYPVVSVDQEGLHKIAAYYAVPPTASSLRSAIYDLGPVGFSSSWYSSWFRPVNGVLPPPTSKVGRHFFIAYGWDASGRILCRNSWGTDWGLAGDFLIPAGYLNADGTSGAWKTADVIEHPIPYRHTVDVTARPSLRVRKAPTTAAAKVGELAHGKDVVTTRLEKYGGKYVANGRTRTDWLEVKLSSTRRGWIARGYTRLVR